jgi:hypothetical protein
MRRAILFAGLLGIVATAPARVRASTELEGDGFAGTSPGGWACGPVGRVNYAGGGARVRIAEKPAALGGKGFSGEVAGSAAYEKTEFVRCDRECDEDDHVMPPARVQYAGRARVGYGWDVFGIEAGAVGFEYWKENTSTNPTFQVIPDVELSLRSGDAVKGMIGFGSPTVTTLSRPGLYAGVRVPVATAEFQSYIGAFRMGPTDAAGFRTDVAALMPIAPALRVRVGLSGSGVDPGGLGVEGSAGLVGNL